MAEAIEYVVVCACDGKIEPVAYIDDNRPTGGAVVVSAAADPEGKQIISATGYHPEIENWRAPDGYIAGKWAERNVSETLWDDTRTGWTIRCGRCRQQAQMSQATLERIVGAIKPDQLPSVPTPHLGEPEVQSWTEDGWVASEIETAAQWRPRSVIPLGVLVRESQRNG
jgi:hypothetical protein